MEGLSRWSSLMEWGSKAFPMSPQSLEAEENGEAVIHQGGQNPVLKKAQEEEKPGSPSAAHQKPRHPLALQPCAPQATSPPLSSSTSNGAQISWNTQRILRCFSFGNSIAHSKPYHQASSSSKRRPLMGGCVYM